MFGVDLVSDLLFSSEHRPFSELGSDWVVSPERPRPPIKGNHSRRGRDLHNRPGQFRDRELPYQERAARAKAELPTRVDPARFPPSRSLSSVSSFTAYSLLSG